MGRKLAPEYVEELTITALDNMSRARTGVDPEAGSLANQGSDALDTLAATTLNVAGFGAGNAAVNRATAPKRPKPPEPSGQPTEAASELDDAGRLSTTRDRFIEGQLAAGRSGPAILEAAVAAGFEPADVRRGIAEALGTEPTAPDQPNRVNGRSRQDLPPEAPQDREPIDAAQRPQTANQASPPNLPPGGQGTRQGATGEATELTQPKPPPRRDQQPEPVVPGVDPERLRIATEALREADIPEAVIADMHPEDIIEAADVPDVPQPEQPSGFDPTSPVPQLPAPIKPPTKPVAQPDQSSTGPPPANVSPVSTDGGAAAPVNTDNDVAQPAEQTVLDPEAVGRIERLAQVHERSAQRSEGGTGYGVGGGEIDARWKADGLRSFVRRVNQGEPIESAARATKAEMAGWVERHNEQRRGDINWRRDPQSGQRTIDTAVAMLRQGGENPQPKKTVGQRIAPAELADSAKPKRTVGQRINRQSVPETGSAEGDAPFTAQDVAPGVVSNASTAPEAVGGTPSASQPTASTTAAQQSRQRYFAEQPLADRAETGPSVRLSRQRIERERPLRGEESEAGTSAQTIIGAWSRAFRVPINTGRMPAIPKRLGKVQGIYDGLDPSGPVPRSIRLDNQHAVDLLVAAHEVAHHLDRVTGITTPSPQHPKPSLPDRLHDELADLDYSQSGDVSEGWAEFLRLWMTEPTATDADGVAITGPTVHAPQTTKWLEQTWMNEPANKLWAKRLRAARGQANRHNAQSLNALVKTMIGSDHREEMPLADRMRQKFGKLARTIRRHAYNVDGRFVDMFRDAQKAGYSGINPETIVSWARHSVAPMADRAIADGVHNIATGKPIGEAKGLAERLTGHLRSDIEVDEAMEFGLARHTLHMAERNPGYRSPMTPEQAERYMSQFDDDTRQRYEETAKQISRYGDELLDMRVAAGSLTQESADRMKAAYANDNWFPMQRVQDGDAPMGSSSPRSIVRGQHSIRRRSDTGSDKPIVDPVEQLIRRTQQHYATAAKSRVTRVLKDMVDSTEGLGWFGRPVKADQQPTRQELGKVVDQLVKSGIVDPQDARAAKIASKHRDGKPLEPDEAALLAARHGYSGELSPAELDGIVALEPDLSDVLETWAPNYQPDPDRNVAVIVSPDGSKQLYEFDPELYAALEGLTQPHLHAAARIIKAWSRGFKAATVGMNATFAAGNLPMDTLFANVATSRYMGPLEAITSPVKEGIAAAADKAKRATGRQREMTSLGLLYSEITGDQTSEMTGGGASVQSHARQITGKSLKRRLGYDPRFPITSTARAIKSAAGRPLTAIEAVVALSDVPARRAEGKAYLREAGYQDAGGGRWKNTRSGKTVDHLPEEVRLGFLDAISEVTTNFRRRGKTMAYIDVISPFTVASVNGQVRYLRAAMNTASKIKSGDVFATAAGKRTRSIQEAGDIRQAQRFIVGHSVLFGAGLLYALARGDDEDYQEQPPWLRRDYWTFTDGEGQTTFSMPKPHAFRSMLAALEDQVADLPASRRRSILGHLLQEALNWIPGGGGPIKAGGEVMMNEDRFTGREIEPSYLDDGRPDSMIADENTTWASIQAAAMLERVGLDDISPMQLDHLADGTTGGAYNKAVGTVQKVNEGRYGLADVPGVRRFWKDRSYDASVQDFYDTIEQTTADAYRAEAAGRGDELARHESKLAKLDTAKGLLRSIRHAAPTDDPYRFTPQRVGVAREALGYSPLKNFPAPWDMEDPPEALAEAVKQHAAAMTPKAILGTGRPQSVSDKLPRSEQAADLKARQTAWDEARETDLAWLESHKHSQPVRDAITEATRSDRYRKVARHPAGRGNRSWDTYRRVMLDWQRAREAADRLGK